MRGARAMMETETAGKKIYLTNEQQRDVAIWLIQNGHVTKDKNTESQDYTYWRTKRTVAIDEINKAMLPNIPMITIGNIIGALKFFNMIKSWAGIVIHAPTIDDSVQNDILTAENKKLRSANDAITVTLKLRDAEIANFKLKLATANKYDKYEDAFRAIVKAIPTDIFEKKK